jgi:predicted aldo/keto reductase-like oxidoreductase
MQYVKYGRTGLRISRFGLGCMRFPGSEIEAIEMVRYALDHGVNYTDTAYVYGNSELILGKALKDGYRDKTYLATKSPIWNITKHEDFEKYLDEQLIRLGTDHMDIYLLHNLGLNNWQTVKKYDGFTFLDKMIQKGKIGHKAFSFHGTLALFEEVVDAYDWEMAQIQLNILDEYQQAGVEGLQYASQRGMAVVIMEPLRGGHVINQCPPKALDLINAYPEKRSLIEWAFRWLYNMPQATVILSGTSTLEQLKDNLHIFENAHPNVMSSGDLNFIKNIREAFEAKNSINCTGCKYCMPCPSGVDIPQIFRLYNNAGMMEGYLVDRVVYQNTVVPGGYGADQCIECGLCMEHCPQSIKITENLQKAHQTLMQKFK